jgi:hypothetical protein
MKKNKMVVFDWSKKPRKCDKWVKSQSFFTKKKEPQHVKQTNRKKPQHYLLIYLRILQEQQSSILTRGPHEDANFFHKK